MKTYRINEFKVKYDESQEIDNLKGLFISFLRLKANEASGIAAFSIYKKSVDARKKPDIYYTYSFIFSFNEALISGTRIKEILKRNKNISEYSDTPYSFPYSFAAKATPEYRPVVVGAGPAGLFCAYYLSLYNLKPIIIERGEDCDKRTQTVNDFLENGHLNTDSNVQFGEGGAGTFSDGKLNTGVKDKYGRIRRVLEIFVENGAPANILYDAKPHIGTDILKNVVKNIRNKIISGGGEFLFNSRLDDILVNNNPDKPHSLVIYDISSKKTITVLSKCICLAMGHSARDTFRMLNKRGILLENKPFAVGFRVIHSQEMINNSMYGSANHLLLPAADYKLTYRANDQRGVYSFCMCPGGFVINGSSENNRTCVNGMSYSARDGKFANSAIIMTIDNRDFGDKLFGSMEFQETIEGNAFRLGNGSIPVQRLCDFKEGAEKVFAVPDCIKGQYKCASLTELLPEYLTQDFIESFSHFGRIIEGFDSDDTIIAGVEARTSSPVKILRDDDYMCNIKGIFPCGEGAGYAGGIISAAVDGVKVAERICKVYN